MTRAAWIALCTTTAVALGGGGLLAHRLIRENEATKPRPPQVHVPARYAQLRKGQGHDVHVDREGIACAKCHDVERGFHNPGSEPCRGCHEQEARIEHAPARGAAHGGERSADCSACHSFGSEPEDQSWQCMRCHELPQGELHAVEVHASKPCKQCHSPHASEPIQPTACTSCHAEAANGHAAGASAHALAGAGADLASNCLTCHDGHAPAQHAVESCESCHDKPHALFEGHRECVSCHVPHAFERSAAADCKDCHAGRQVLASATVAAHRECTACHSPHEVAASDASCTRCHSGISPQHPPTAAGASCTGCHQPHPTSATRNASAHGNAQACSHCHQAAGDRGFHGGRAECVSCHRPHAFSQVEQAQACASCHGEQIALVAGNAGHERCAGCHKSHPHAAELPPAACRECHQKTSVSAAHEKCTSCHEPHAGKSLTIAQSCARCHAREHQHVVPGHAQCTACHAPHGAAHAAGASCEQCHAGKTAAPHGQLASGCESCHAVHAAGGVRKAPACQSCHKRPTLPGLHGVAEHADCARCHTGAHATGPWSSRATCIACHAAQKDHQPEARLCQGCHVFRQ